MILGHEVATVGGRIDQHIVRHGGDRPIEHALEGLVGILAFLEGQVIAEQYEALGPSAHHLDDLGQVDEIGLVDLDQAQALRAVLIEQGLDQGRLPGAAGTGQEHVVGAPSGQELARVAIDARLLLVNILQILKADAVPHAHRRERCTPMSALPAESHGGVPVGRSRRAREQGFEALEHALGATQQVCEFSHRVCCRHWHRAQSARPVVVARCSRR